MRKYADMFNKVNANLKKSILSRYKSILNGSYTLGILHKHRKKKITGLYFKRQSTISSRLWNYKQNLIFNKSLTKVCC